VANCLVLGADGFLGSHLIDKLVKDGHSVKAFDRFPNGVSRHLNTALHKNVEIFAGDFLNRHDLEAAIQNSQYVFHFISTTNPASSSQDPLIDVDTNIRMSVELLQVCTQANVKKVIFPSTGGAIYGRHSDKPFTEEDRTEPISPYAIGKLTIEGYLRYFHQAHGLDYVIYRVSNPYGERQNVVGSQGAIPIFLNLIRHGRPLTIFGDGSMVRDFIYVQDVAEMITASFAKKNKYPVYNIGSGQAISVNSLIEKLREVTGEPVKVMNLPIRPTDVDTVTLDIKRFQTEYGAREFTNLENGIHTTWEYVNNLPA